MTVIAPAILVETSEAYQRYIDTLLPFAHRVHIDITDEEFAPSKTVTLDEVWWPREWLADIHMMVDYPSRYVSKLIRMKPHLVILHAECKEPLLPILRQLRAAGIRVAVGLLARTHPHEAERELEAADGAMIFSGDLGHYGGKANPLLLHKVAAIRGIDPHAEIGWDGGVNLENARDLARGGIDVLNVGGCISHADDPHAMYQLLERAVK